MVGFRPNADRGALVVGNVEAAGAATGGGVGAEDDLPLIPIPLLLLLVLVPASSGSMISEGLVTLTLGGIMFTSSISSRMIVGLEGTSLFCFFGDGRSSSSTSSTLTLGGRFPLAFGGESPLTELNVCGGVGGSGDLRGALAKKSHPHWINL